MQSAMTNRERVLSCFDRTGYDRIPVKHEGTPEVNQMLMLFLLSFVLSWWWLLSGSNRECPLYESGKESLSFQ